MARVYTRGAENVMACLEKKRSKTYIFSFCQNFVDCLGQESINTPSYINTNEKYNCKNQKNNVIMCMKDDTNFLTFS